MRSNTVSAESTKAVNLVKSVLFLLVFGMPCAAQYGGPYEISWYTIDGGGGTSIGGTGTGGQTNALPTSFDIAQDRGGRAKQARRWRKL